MKFRTLGKSGFSVSEVGLGCWQLGNDFGPVEDERAQNILKEADTQKITFWDTADVYGGGLSETRIGEHTQAYAKERVVVTKVGRDGELYPDGYTKDKVKHNIQGSLKRLGVEALDLVQLHCVPTAVLKSGDMLAWMEDLQQDGLIKAFGVSVETMDEALFAVEHPSITSIQTIFNLFRQDHISQLFPKALKNNVGIIVRLPLASGVLSGKYTKSQQFAEGDHRNYNKDGAYFSVGETFSGIPFEQAVEFANELKALVPEKMTLAQMAMRWILDQEAVSSIITGASRVEQVIENASVSDLPSLPEALHNKLFDLYKNQYKSHIRGVM